MADMKMLGNMFEMADKNQTLKEGWFSDYIKELRKPWEKRVHSGDLKKEFLDLFDCEVSGNKCPICKTAPEKYSKEIIWGGHRLGDMTFYRLLCSCWEDLSKQGDKDISTKNRIALADIPVSYSSSTWSSWDQTADKELTKSFHRVKDFSHSAGLSHLIGNGLIMYGDVGRGKTLSGICLMKSVLGNTNLKCVYIPMADFTNRIIMSGKEGDYLTQIERFDFIFLDDLDKLSTSSTWVQERVFSLFDNLFRTNKTLILTTNLKTIPDMEKYFGIHGEAIISRMVDKMDFVKFIGGEDYRKVRRKKKMDNGSN